jgi:HPt (histidine-containing phosphotransfer) domain-containing protein
LRAACAASQPAAAAATAHKLKSSARAVGAFALADLCEAIEGEGKAGKAETLVTLLPRFDEEMAAVNDYLDSYEHDSRLPSRRLPGAIEPDR